MSFENRRKDFLLIFYNSIKTYKYIRGFQNEKLNTRNGKLKAGYEFQGLRDLFANPFFLNDIYRSSKNVLSSKKCKLTKIPTFS